MLGDCLTTTSYSWDGCKFISEDYTIRFEVTVVDEYGNEKSKVEKRRLNLPNEILLNLMVDCGSNYVRANWELTSYPYNVDEYCLEYECGAVKKEMVCYPYFVHSCSYILLSVCLCLVQHGPYHT